MAKWFNGVCTVLLIQALIELGKALWAHDSNSALNWGISTFIVLVAFLITAVEATE